MPAKFVRPKCNGSVTIRQLEPPQLETTAKITKGELTESLKDIAARLGVNQCDDLSLVDVSGLSFFSKLVDGAIYYISGAVSDCEKVFLNPDISVAWAFDKRVLLHEPKFHRSPETPYRLERAVEMLRSSDHALDILPPELSSGSYLNRKERLHSPCYIPSRLASIEEILSFHDKNVYSAFVATVHR